MSAAKRTKVGNQLEQLSQFTTVVADTGDFESIAQFRPTDATTNPSLVFKAAQLPQYAGLVDDAVAWAKAQESDDTLALTIDRLSVLFGKEILGIVPGYVSTEVDARLSYDTEGTIARARRIIGMYEAEGVSKERVLIKIASTWEGIRAAEVLEQEGIRCNLTLLFSLAQAVACAEAGATLISPFVGRILDWFKKDTGRDGYPAEEDPGVISVTGIYQYFKKFGYNTIVMGASFRNKGEILALAGCDRLTISPALLQQLQESDEPVERRLEPEAAQAADVERIDVSEPAFRLAMCMDAMATEKLAHGIRGFSADLVKLEGILQEKLSA